MAGYYDYVLVLIPVALLGVGGVLVAAGTAPVPAVSVASLFALGVVGHALFVNGPTDETEDPPESTDTALAAD